MQVKQYIPLLKEFSNNKTNPEIIKFIEDLISYINEEPANPQEIVGQYGEILIEILIEAIKSEKYSGIYLAQNDDLSNDFMYCEEGHKPLDQVFIAILKDLALLMIGSFNKSMSVSSFIPTLFQKRFNDGDYTNPFTKNKLDTIFIHLIIGILKETNAVPSLFLE